LNAVSELSEPALNKPVTVAASGQTVQELLEILNTPERPQLQAQEPVGWQHVTVYVRQQPVEKIMAGLKTLFNGVWVHNVSDPAQVRYVLKSTGRAQEYDKELYRLTLERGAEPMLRLAEYLKTPEETFDQMVWESVKTHKEPSDPLVKNNLNYLSRSGPREGMALLATLSPEQRFTLLSTGMYLLPVSAMTERQLQMAHNMGLSAGRMLAKLGFLLEGETPEDKAQITDQWGVALKAKVHPVTGAFLNLYCSTGVSGLAVASTEDDMPPPTPLLAVRGNPYHYSPGSKAKLPVYPDLQKLPFPSGFKLEKGQEVAWRDVLAELAKHIALPIYSDDFTFSTIAQDRLYGSRDDKIDPSVRSFAARPKFTKLTLPEGLDALCNQYGYLWWYRDGALFFRSRTWFIEQQYEVPPSVLAFVRKQLKTESKLNAEGLMVLSTLTKKQLLALCSTNLTYGPEQIKRREEVGARSYDFSVRFEESGDFEIAWDSLQIFALFNDEQKQKALSSEGLPLMEMNPTAQQAIVQMLFAQQNVMNLKDPSKVRFIASQRSDLPAQLDGPRQANVTFSLGENIGWGGKVAIRYTPVKPKTPDAPKQ
jgi:hypothetical protein